MGRGMAANIAKAGIPLRAWNRSREKAEPLTEQGATVVDSPAQAAEGASIVLTMLPDVDAVIDVMDSEQGFFSAAGDSLIWAQMSTIGVVGIERRSMRPICR